MSKLSSEKDNIFNWYKCFCKYGFEGEKCEIQNFCKQSPCNAPIDHPRFTSCSEDTYTEDYYCNCRGNFGGKDCDQCLPGWENPAKLCKVQAQCKLNKCDSKGTEFCEEDEILKSYKCNCKTGYFGFNCDKKNHCFENGEPHGYCEYGECRSEDSSYNCTCQENYELVTEYDNRILGDKIPDERYLIYKNKTSPRCENECTQYNFKIHA